VIIDADYVRIWTKVICGLFLCSVSEFSSGQTEENRGNTLVRERWHPSRDSNEVHSECSLFGDCE
jgi:hypothetical protein